MAQNFVRITVYPDRFEVWPPCPQVLAAAEPLKVGIIWDNDPGTWQSVTVQNFVDESKSNVPTMGANPVFDRAAGNVVKEIHFKFLVSDDTYCKYDLVYLKSGTSGDSYTVDPTILLRKLE